MKRLITLSLLFLTPLLALGSLVIDKDYNSGSVHQVATLMSQTISDLFNGHTPDDDYKSFVFTSNLFFNGKFYTDKNPIFNKPYTSLGSDLLFKEVPNTESFIIKNFAYIAFIGNESADNNKLFVEFDGAKELLFNYRSKASNSQTPAPTTAELFTQDSAQIKFVHQNPLKGFAYQLSPERFRFFQSYDPTTLINTNHLILVIDDREDTLVDHDDGFFYITAGEITPVPEPSLITTLSVLSLGGILFFKRFLNKKK